MKNNFQSILDNGIFLNSSGTTGKPKSLFQPPKKLKLAKKQMIKFSR